MMLLRPAAWIYGGAVALRNRMFDAGILSQVRVPVPVISVGNLTAGGSGKTPLVEYIVDCLTRLGVKTGTLSRGYGRSTRGTMIVSDGERVLADTAEAGDEPVQIARKFRPAVVMVDERRIRGARFMIDRFHVGCIVLDDGFQHRYLKRDLDIVLIDAADLQTSPVLLPAGRFREPLHALKRAGCVVLIRSSEGADDPAAGIRKYYGGPVVTAEKQPAALVGIGGRNRTDPGAEPRMSCYAFCGIAKPESFRTTLAAAGYDVRGLRVFGDHHRYSPAELREIALQAEHAGSRLIVTTEKDAARIAGGLREITDDRWRYLEIRMKIVEGEQVLKDMIARTAGVTR